MYLPNSATQQFQVITLIFNSIKRTKQVRKKKKHFQTLKMNKTSATAQIFWAKILNSLTFLVPVFKISLTNYQNSLNFP